MFALETPNARCYHAPVSAIASFVKIPKSSLEGLRSAAIPKKRLFRPAIDSYDDFLRDHGTEVADYRWSGYILATLLPYLEEEQQIDLMTSEYDELSSFLTEARGATYFVFTDGHKAAYLEKLRANLFSEAELRDFFNEFNETSEEEMGKAMLDGVTALHDCLLKVDPDSVVILGIA